MLVGACCGERGTKVIWVTCIQEICYSKISGSRRLKNAHVEWLVVAFGRLMKWVKNPYKIVPLLSRSLGTSCQTKLRHWYFSPFCIAGGQGNYTFMADLFYISYMFIQMQMCVCVDGCHGLSNLRATTHCISQECILPGFTTGEKRISDGTLIIKNIIGIPRVQPRIWKTDYSNGQTGPTGWMRLNAVESCRMHTAEGTRWSWTTR